MAEHRRVNMWERFRERFWERFRERKARKYGSFGEYAERRALQIAGLMLVLGMAALILSAVWPMPTVSF